MKTVHCEGGLAAVSFTVAECAKTFSLRYNMLRHIKQEHEKFSDERV
jgi:hypothetical protein